MNENRVNPKYTAAEILLHEYPRRENGCPMLRLRLYRKRKQVKWEVFKNGEYVPYADELLRATVMRHLDNRNPPLSTRSPYVGEIISWIKAHVIDTGGAVGLNGEYVRL